MRVSTEGIGSAADAFRGDSKHALLTVHCRFIPQYVSVSLRRPPGSGREKSWESQLAGQAEWGRWLGIRKSWTLRFDDALGINRPAAMLHAKQFL